MTTHTLLILLILTPLDRGVDLVAFQAPASSCDSTTLLPPSVPADSVDTRPSITSPHKTLQYPPGLVMAGVTGEVLLAYDVDSTGVVDHCSIRIISAKRSELVTAAKSFVTGLRFTPGIRAGAFVRTRVEQRIRFQKRNGDRGRHHVF